MKLKGKVMRRNLKKKWYSKLRKKWMTCDYTTTAIQIHVPKKLEKNFKKSEEVEVFIKNKKGENYLHVSFMFLDLQLGQAS